MRVLLLNKYSSRAASSRLRTLQYVPKLAENGVCIESVPLFDSEYLARLWAKKSPGAGKVLLAYCNRIKKIYKSKNYDYLWIERELLPWIPWHVEKILRLYKVPYIFDLDDAIFHRYEFHSSWLFRLLFSQKIDTLMANSATVIAGNQYIAERAKMAGAVSVEVIPTVVDLSRYTVKKSRPGSHFVIGWIGTPSTEKYLHLIKGALARISREISVKVKLVGCNTLSMDGVDIDILPWTEDKEVEYIQSFDVGIMPLTDEPWERGKCGYKLIQYMACGKPVVASPVGINTELVRNETGLLARTNEEWYRALKSLSSQKELRKKLGDNGRRIVVQHYSLEQAAPKIINIFNCLEKRLGV